MEEQSAPSGAEHSSFLRIESCEYIVPVGDLPEKFRSAIDRGYTTGWSNLDRYIQGIRHGEVTVITADTGVGKTTFATHLLCNLAMQGVPVWINSWEMGPETIMRKLASIVLRKNMKLQEFLRSDNEAFDAWCARYTVYLNPMTIGLDIASLAQQLKKASEMGIQVVLLDHLDYLVSSKRERLNEAIEETVRALHELAFFFRMHFILICHPRQSATAQEEIGIHSLKGSSSIKQYADNIIVLHRCSRTDAQECTTKTKIKVVKNRMFGIEGSAFLFYEQWDGYIQIQEIHESCRKTH